MTTKDNDLISRKALIEFLTDNDVNMWFSNDFIFEAIKNAPTIEADSGEDVAWQFYQDGKWHNGMETNSHKQNTIDAGFPVRELYASQSLQAHDETKGK
jgi:hypothetical protein